MGAALIRRGRLLAARRRGPGPNAGGWELPGGKVEAGEDDLSALVREIREELAVTVMAERPVVTAAGSADWPLPGVGVLRVWTVRVIDAAEPQALADHDRLRWLRRGEAFDVDWLPADRGVVEQLLGQEGRWPDEGVADSP